MVEHSTEIAVAADAAGLQTLQNWIAARLAGQAVTTVARIQLVIEELFANAREHGGGRRAAIRLALTIEKKATEASICLRYTDDLAPFDSTAQPPERSSSQPGGWGLSLIKQLPERCRYLRENDKNRIDLEFRATPV
jgi:anti-sigma regulatory factor (Ser/Thr protein kinase)